MDSIDLSFEVVSGGMADSAYSAGCTSGGSSGCCTAICSGGCKGSIESASQAAWDRYLEVNEGVLQY